MHKRALPFVQAPIAAAARGADRVIDGSDDDGSDAPVDGSNCVAEGSLVSTPRGRIPIERMRLGDELYSVNPETGELVIVQLVALREATRECVELQLSDREWLTCTPDHPIYDPDLRDYRPAGDWVLRRAARLMTGDGDGLRARATSLALAYVGLAQVFDLTVTGPHHNFLANGILVHNKHRSPDEG